MYIRCSVEVLVFLSVIICKSLKIWIQVSYNHDVLEEICWGWKGIDESYVLIIYASQGFLHTGLYCGGHHDVDWYP